MNTSLSFDQAIRVATDLIQRTQESGSSGAKDAHTSCRELLTEIASARGFFVALLTGEWQFGDEIPDSIIETCTKAGPVADELLAKNLIMSSCTCVQHTRSGNLENAAGSERVIRRTQYIIENQRAVSASLTEELVSMKKAIAEALSNTTEQSTNNLKVASKYTDFLIKWKYDSQQLTFAQENLDDVLRKVAQQPKSK